MATNADVRPWYEQKCEYCCRFFTKANPESGKRVGVCTQCVEAAQGLDFSLNEYGGVD
jgi:hypothetical protein